MVYQFVRVTVILLAAVSFVDAGGSWPSQKRATPPAVQTENWARFGVAFKLPPGWKKTNEDDDSMDWEGPANLKFRLVIGLYKPEYGNFSIEDETRGFYEDHRKYGEEDLRYLEVGGLKGVHYLRDNETFDQRNHMYKAKFIIWNSQWLYKGRRQVVIVNLSSPVEMFPKDRGTLYGIMQSMTFSR